MDWGQILEIIKDWLTTSGLKIVIILLLVWIALRILHSVVHRVVRKTVEQSYHIRDKASIEKRVKTIHNVLYSVLHVVVWIVALMIVLSEFDVEIGPILAAAGIAGLAFGFGAQYLIRDLIAGLMIILEDQYRTGDVVRIAGIAGAVENITLRKTTLRDLDGLEHHVPNGEIKATSNFTKLYSRVNLNISIAYDADLEKAIRVLNKIGEGMMKEDPWKSGITDQIKCLGVDKFADSAVELKVLGETKPGKQWDAMREYRRRVKVEFDRAGVEIPYPHRTIIQKKS